MGAVSLRLQLRIGRLAIGLAVALWAASAIAGPFGVRYMGGNAPPPPADGQFRRQPPHEPPTYNNQRNDRRDDMRQQRLSPEERQQLRRDIRDAGREIYPPRR